MIELLEIPRGWECKQLEEVCVKIADRDHITPKYVEDGVPLISPRDFLENSISFENCKKISKEAHEINKKRTNIEYGDILFSRIGTIGKVRLVETDKEFSILHSIVLIKPNEKEILRDYLFYYLKSPIIQKQSFEDVRSIGTPDLGIKKIRSFKIQYPKIGKQEVIVAKLNKIMKKLNSNKQQIQKNNELQKESISEEVSISYNKILESAFQGKLTKSFQYPSTTQLLKKIRKKSIDYKNKRNHFEEDFDMKKLLQIPKDWRWVEFNELIESMRNGIYKPAKFYGSGIPSLRMYNIKNGKINKNNLKQLELTQQEFDQFKLEPNDILINRVNSRELVGKSAVIPTWLGPAVFESKNIRVKLWSELVNPYFVNYFLQTIGHRNKVSSKCKQTAGMATISQPDIEKWPIPLCSIEEQNDVVNEIERRLKVIEILNQTKTEIFKMTEDQELYLKQLTDSVLEYAFAGKLVN